MKYFFLETAPGQMTGEVRFINGSGGTESVKAIEVMKR